jgi:hypothetical protein
MNIHDPDPPDWPWYLDRLIIAAAVWWVWSGRAPK